MPLLAREAISPWISKKRRLRGIAILVLASCTVGLVMQLPTRFGAWSKSKTDVVHAVVKDLAFDAYAAWAVQHPDRDCPSSLDELTRYSNHASARDSRDAWGRRFHYACGERTVPSTAHGIWVVSAGEDGRFGTDDDIRSDR